MHKICIIQSLAKVTAVDSNVAAADDVIKPVNDIKATIFLKERNKDL